MPEFLSDAWIAALDEAARADDRLREAVAHRPLVVEQRVTGADGDGRREVVYHVVLGGGDGAAAVAPGPAADPDIRFVQDLGTAVEIAAGRLSAQRAFMAGRLQVGGDLRSLVDRADVLAALHDTFAAVRADTTGLATTAHPGPP